MFSKLGYILPNTQKKEAKVAHIVLAIFFAIGLYSAFVVLFQTQAIFSPLLAFIFGP